MAEVIEPRTLRAAKPKSATAAKPNFLGVNKLNKTHFFIDAMNMLGMLRSINKRLDFTEFLDFIRDESRLIRASYFVLMREDIGEGAHRTIDMMEYAGYDVNKKWIEEFQDQSGHYRSRGTVVPEMTVAILDAVEAGADHIFLWTGDAEMHAAVLAAKQREARVTLLGIDGAVADVLKRECDDFIDVTSLPENIWLR